MSQQPINHPINHPLAPGYLLSGYRIDKQLSQGGFSLVYLAYDQHEMPVAIKEYLPVGLSWRPADSPVPVVNPAHQAAYNHGLASFFEEGRLLAQLDHPNVVRVLDFFRANQTAYLVMRYERGRTLQAHIQKQVGDLGEGFIRNVFVRLLNGLREVHMRKLLHLDIKPANIYLRSGAQPVLLDFGATRQGLGTSEFALKDVCTRGYAAPEQTGSGEAQGPWTDIYAVGASLYACLAKGTPLAADLRMQQDQLEPALQRWGKLYSPQLLELIDWCLRLPIATRPQSVFALQKVLNGELLDLVDPAWFDKVTTEPPANGR